MSGGGSELVLKFFSMAVSCTAIVILDQESDKPLYIIYLIMNESALAESIITQLIHAHEWHCQTPLKFLFASYSVVIAIKVKVYSYTPKRGRVRAL